MAEESGSRTHRRRFLLLARQLIVCQLPNKIFLRKPHGFAPYLSAIVLNLLLSLSCNTGPLLGRPIALCSGQYWFEFKQW